MKLLPTFVDSDEARAVRLSFAAFFLLMCGYYLLRPVREAWGLEAGIDKLPSMFLATFLASLVVVPLYSRLVSRCSRRRIVPIVMHSIVGCLLLFHVALRLELPREAMGLAFFVWLSVINLFIVAVFWSLMADLFRSEQARRLFGCIAAGGSAGAIVGPLLAGQLVGPLGLANLLLVSAVLLEGEVWCVQRLLGIVRERAPDGGARAGARLGGSIWAGFTATIRKPYLGLLAIQMLLTTSAATVLYFLQAMIVSNAAGGTEARLAIFANIDLVTSLLAAFVQLLVTGPLLLRWGAGVPLRISAGLLAVSLLLLARWPLLPVLKSVQALRRASHYALERPGLNLLFTVVSTEDKYKAKGFTDTVVYRGGDAGVAQLLGSLDLMSLGTTAISLAAVPLAAGGWWLSGVLSRRHRALERDLQLTLESTPVLGQPADKEHSS